MAKNKVNIWIVVATVLAILLICCITYICVGKYRASRDAEKTEIFQSGALFGYESAVKQIMDSAVNCQPANVYLNNNTMDLIDVSCVKK